MENEINNWDEIGVKEEILRGIYGYGFDKPSDIQKKAIKPIIEKKDIIAQAQSGSGKTGTFAISALETIDVSKKETQVLILSPTHELVHQTARVVQDIGSYLQGLVIKILIGGTSTRDDIHFFNEKTPHIVVGTVGRVLDMFHKNQLLGNDLRLLILDEADEMLSQGFYEKIKIMFQNYFPLKMQVALFSATIPSEVLAIGERFMINPERILVKREELSLKCIEQYFVALNHDNMKYETLKDIYSMISVDKCIIYCNTLRRVIDLYNNMTQDNFSVCCIHSNMSKQERHNNFMKFRNGDTRVMISSDITARGIDIQQVSLVINYDLTRNVHTYLHRIGRGGRWGRKGLAINFITMYDIPEIKKIENHYHINIEQLPQNFSTIIT